MPRTDGVFIIWPERRFVPAKVIRTWFLDAVANGKIDPQVDDADTLHEWAAALSQAGLITLRGNI